MKKLLTLAVTTTLAMASTADPLVIYSERNEQLIKPILDRYSEVSGVQYELLIDKSAPLIAKLKAEGKRTPADVLITVDAGNLWHAANEGVLQSINSKILEEKVPAELQDPENNWFALTVRARTIVFHKDRVNAADLSTYEALADEQWKGRLCLRTSKKVYNQSLVGSMISRLGEKRTMEVVSGWVANLATEPTSSDTKALDALLAGQCDVALVNTYYFGRKLKADPNLPLEIFWPNQQTSGVHINVSGAGVTQHSDQPEAAIKFLEWMVSDEAQAMYASMDMEFPVVAGAKLDPIVESWGSFKADSNPIYKAGEYQRKAVMLMDAARYK